MDDKTEVWAEIAMIRRDLRKLAAKIAVLDLHETNNYLDRAIGYLQRAVDHVDD